MRGEALISTPLHFETWHAPEVPGESDALVFLHGFAGSVASWRGVAEALLSSGRSGSTPAMVGVALPGHHPGSPPHPDEPFEEATSRLVATLHEIAVGPVHLVGYSLGARLALSATLLHPEDVARATLVGGHPGLQESAERAARREADAHWVSLLRDEGIERFVRAWSAQPVFASQADLDENVRRERDRERGAHDPEALAGAMLQLGLGRMPPYLNRLATVEQPVTLVAGERDTKFCELARRMVERLSRGHLRTIDRCGHNPLLEAPARIVEILSEERTP